MIRIDSTPIALATAARGGKLDGMPLAVAKTERVATASRGLVIAECGGRIEAAGQQVRSRQ